MIPTTPYQAPARTKIPGIPEAIWHTEATETEGQVIGCFRCLASGVQEPPSMIFFVNGSTYCRTHVLNGG